MLTFILFWILYCITEGFDHAWYNEINHWRASLRRIALGIIVVYSLCGVSTNVVLYINVAVLLASIFTVVFDITRNLAKGQAWNYIGETASIDKLLRKYPVAAWGAKFAIVLLSIIVLYYNSHYIVIVHPLINTTWLF